EKPYAPNRPPVEERGVAEYNHLPRSVVCTSVAGDGRNGVRHWQTSCLDGSLRAANRTGRRRSPGDELNWMQSHPRRVREPRIHATFCTVPTWRCPPPMRNSQSRTEIRSNVSRTSPLQKRTKHPGQVLGQFLSEGSLSPFLECQQAAIRVVTLLFSSQPL